MIKTPTVFVLGAGASTVFGFPVGQALCQLVYERFVSGHSNRKELLEVVDFEERHLDSFRNELFRSGQSSVDLFLEYRPEFLDVGKAAMALLLSRYEGSDMLFNFQPDNWLKYLLNQLRAEFDDFKNNKVSFITFNYDRSLEHFLFASLRSSYGRSVEECAAIFKSIRIIHLHGRLGYLPWEGQKNAREYSSAPLDVATMKICRDGIRVVHETIDAERDKEFAEAKQLMAAASRIYYLGFGFGQKNIERLDIRNLDISAKTVRGTGIGLTNAEVTRINNACAGKATPQADQDCIGLLRNYVLWD